MTTISRVQRCALALCVSVVLCVCLALANSRAAAQEIAPAENLKKLSKDHALYLDATRNALVIDGVVCLRQGQLEMFACPKGTKEHEAVVALDCHAQEVHAALLAMGAKPGKPVKFQPTYEPATGQVIDVFVLWKDEQGKKHQVRAQEWVRNAKTKMALAADWVFAGSGFWKDEQDGKEHYRANGGDFICVSNFPSAMLDLPVESTQANSELLFDAFTENIPPKGTKVRVVLIPRAEKPGEKVAPAGK